ncbi:MAG: 4-hydroxy-3-methylbut-2-enyl diphosphate reductase [Desulfovibrionales bacterium]
MTVVRASTAGFCMGVALALKRLDRCLHNRPDLNTHTFGPIIHNPQVLARYRRLGVREADSLEKIHHPAQVVIRAHGIPWEMQEALVQCQAEIVDATCPKVKKAQMLIAEQVKTGKSLLLLGEIDHPEVKGLLSYAGEDAFVFENLDELEKAELDQDKSYVLAAQTTQDRKEFARVREHLWNRLGHDIPVLDTICDATRQRQKEAREIARTVDLMVVVGGYESGNTRRLVQVIQETGTPCVHVETPAELPLERLARVQAIGLTAGASTPVSLVDMVEKRLHEIKRGPQ